MDFGKTPSMSSIKGIPMANDDIENNDVDRQSEHVSDITPNDEEQVKIIELAQVRLDLIDLQIKRKEIKM